MTETKCSKFLIELIIKMIFNWTEISKWSILIKKLLKMISNNPLKIIALKKMAKNILKKIKNKIESIKFRNKV